jgi:predicted secreted protein
MTTTTIALGERAMLVSLSISIWSARKHDIRISDKVAADHGADRSMGRYAKHLIPRELLTAVNAANSALRDHHNLNTLAWGDDGTRILPAANYLGYQEQQQRLEDAFARAVRDFVACYPQCVEAARKALNGLFDPRDYPAPERIVEKFGVRHHFMPVAQPDDFRVRLGDAQVARIRAEIEARNAELVENANRDLWQRLQEVTARLVERLSAFDVDPVAGTRLHPFRDSLIENVRSLLEIMPRLNITGDAEIERVRHELAGKVACHDPESLREDHTLRAEVVDAASGILAQMEGYC